MQDGLSDIELWELVRIEADHNAFSIIYDKYVRTLYAVAYSKVKNKQTAEDIVHEVMISLWKNRNHTKISSLESYLATAVKYYSISHLRKATRAKVHLTEGDDLLDGVEAENAEDIYQTKYLFQVLQEETDKLPDKCKLVFQYSREHGYKIGEIASELDLSPKTVEAHLSLALKRLKKALKVSLLITFLIR